MNRTKITLLALVSLMATTVAMSGCGGVCNHMDNDGNKLCDLCGASLETAAETDSSSVTTPAADTPPVTEAAKVIISEITVKDQYGNLIEGAVLQINDEENTPVETVTTLKDGTVPITLYEGSYTAVFLELPEYHLGGTVKFEIKEGDAEPVLEIINNTPDGTEAHPFFLNSESTTFTFDANTTYHYTLFAGDRRSVVIENAADITITLEGTTHTPDQTGVIRVPVAAASQQNHLSLSVTSKTAQDVTIGIVSELGSSDNPIVLENTHLNAPIRASIPKDRIVYYAYTVTRGCTLVVSSEDPTNNISMTNHTNSQTTNFTNGSVSEVTLEVASGDKITIAVSVLGGDENADIHSLLFLIEERFAHPLN